MNTITRYFRDSIEELRQVRWPTQQQAIRLTAITIGFIIVCAAFFGFIDAMLTEILRVTL